MAMVTISRELASLGDETAKELAKLLGWRFVDKYTLEERIKSYGVSGEKLGKYDERKPSFFASLSQDRDEYLHYLKSAMLAEAAEGHCVFIGRGACAIFAGLPGLLSVLLVSNSEMRVQRVRSYFHCDERRARQIIAQSDDDRAGFHKYFFEMDWKNPENYVLALNTSLLSPATCANTINLVQSRLLDTEMAAQAELRLRELTLAQQVVNHVMYERRLAVHFFDAAVSGGVTKLYGVANSQALVDSAISASKEVHGVDSVQSDIQIVQEYSVMP